MRAHPPSPIPASGLKACCLRHGGQGGPLARPSALAVPLLAASGLPIEEFVFAGILPSRPTERRKSLKALSSEGRTIVLYEAPHRLLDTLEDAFEILGNRPAVIAREMTKIYEEFLRGHLEDLIANVRKKTPRGEITLLIGPADGLSPSAENAASAQNALPLAKRVEEIVQQRGVDRKAALKQAAKERGLTRREAYKQLLITRDE